MKTGLISKIIKVCIIVIIPLLGAVLVGSQAYKFYQDRFFDYYMEKASDTNTEDRLVSYLEYINESLEYSKEGEEYSFYVREDFSNEHGDLFTVAIIRANEIINEEYTNKLGVTLGKRDNYYLTYYFAIYNINYDTLAKTIDPSGEHPLNYLEIPNLSFKIVDKNDEDLKYEFETTTVATVTGESNLTTIYDYGYSPSKDSKGNKLNGDNPTSMRYYVLDSELLKLFSSEVNIEVVLTANWGSVEAPEPDTVVTIEKNDFYNNELLQDGDNKEALQEEIDEKFTKVYNENVFEAGYQKFVFSKYIWWQALITIILVEVVCASFVLVWNAEDKKQENKKK